MAYFYHFKIFMFNESLRSLREIIKPNLNDLVWPTSITFMYGWMAKKGNSKWGGLY